MNYADHMALIAELLHILTFRLGVKIEDSCLLGLQATTIIQCIGEVNSVPQMVHWMSMQGKGG